MAPSATRRYHRERAAAGQAAAREQAIKALEDCGMTSTKRMRRGFWFAPAAFGLVLMGMGLLIFLRPELLAYMVALTFVTAGFVMLVLAIQMRTRITYRRVDTAFRNDQ